MLAEETERRVVLADVARVVAELQLLERLRVVRVVEPRKAQRAGLSDQKTMKST